MLPKAKASVIYLFVSEYKKKKNICYFVCLDLEEWRQIRQHYIDAHCPHAILMALALCLHTTGEEIIKEEK